MVLGSFRIALGFIACLLINTNGADDYTDENRPYEFGFSIDGQQHRHEKKDKDGIIMGEFGFITADDVYHVTVYATDKEGRFKILSMKNIHLKSSQAGIGTGAPARQGHSLALPSAALSPSATTSTPQLTTKSQIKSVSLEPPARSCSSCSIPTTSTRAPPPALPNSPNQFNSDGTGFAQRPSSVAQSQFGGQQNSYGNKPSYPRPGGLDTSQPNQLNLNNAVSRNSFLGASNNSPSEELNGNRKSESGIGGIRAQTGSKTSHSQIGTGGEAQVSYSQNAGALSPPYYQEGSQPSNPQKVPGKQSSYPQGVVQPSYSQGKTVQQVSRPQVGLGAQSPTYNEQERPGEKASYPQSGPGAPALYPQSGPRSQTPYPQSGPGTQVSYPQSGLGAQTPYPQSGPRTQASYPEGGPGAQAPHPQGKELSSNPGGSSTPSKQYPSLPGVSEEPSPHSQGDINRTPKQFTGTEPRYNSNTSPAKPTLVSAQMQIVDKNTDIHALRPGEKEGLPPGLNQDDMTQLLYTFNYTIGFHGHFEEGFTNGAKKGYYFVTGRNGVKTRIDYTADDTGFHPRISQEVLDLLSDDVPKPETEKDAKYGLKGYEFKWLYYPVGSKKR